MALLRAYLDDSADSKILTIAGYLSTHDLWGQFDLAWKGALHEFEVPYLHMREFGDNEGTYKRIKEAEEEEFFAALIEVIGRHIRFCTQTTVLLDDLKRFNKDQHLGLDPYALAIYGCLMALQEEFPRGEMEVIFDKFERAPSKIEKAKDYFRSDVVRPLSPGAFFDIHSLDKDESWKIILPLQAADFLAWEMRKLCNDPVSWISGYDFQGFGSGLASFNKWADSFSQQAGRPPRDRRSFRELRKSSKPKGFIFNYRALCGLKDLHPYGWKLKSRRRLSLFSGDD